MSKPFYRSNTIQLFTAVALAGGLDILDTLLREEVIGWRSVCLAIIGILGIALRLKTKERVSL
jgi:hypothetical protein